MAYVYKTKGTCSREISVELDGNIVKNVSFVGGCNGNLSGISSIVKGMPIEHVIERLLAQNVVRVRHLAQISWRLR